MYEYMNLETGELLTYAQAMKQFREDYDGDDDTNCIGFEEYFEKVEG